MTPPPLVENEDDPTPLVAMEHTYRYASLLVNPPCQTTYAIPLRDVAQQNKGAYSCLEQDPLFEIHFWSKVYLHLQSIPISIPSQMGVTVLL